MCSTFPNVNWKRVDKPAPSSGLVSNYRWSIEHDLGILKAPSQSPSLVTFATDDYMKKTVITSSRIFAVGYPVGQTFDAWKKTKIRGGTNPDDATHEQYEYEVELWGGGDRKVSSEGIISSAPLVDDNSLVPQNADTHGGFSGCPVVDTNGTVIGFHLGFMLGANVFLPCCSPLFKWVMSQYICDAKATGQPCCNFPTV